MRRTTTVLRAWYIYSIPGSAEDHDLLYFVPDTFTGIVRRTTNCISYLVRLIVRRTTTALCTSYLHSIVRRTKRTWYDFKALPCGPTGVYNNNNMLHFVARRHSVAVERATHPSIRTEPNRTKLSPEAPRTDKTVYEVNHRYMERWWADASGLFFLTSPYSSFHSQTLDNSLPFSLTLAVNWGARQETTTKNAVVRQATRGATARGGGAVGGSNRW